MAIKRNPDIVKRCEPLRAAGTSGQCAIIASHSNGRALLKINLRHLRDGQVRVIGLTLHQTFLATDRPPTIDDRLDHVEHIARIMAQRDGVALGSDMDGGFPPTNTFKRQDVRPDPRAGECGMTSICPPFLINANGYWSGPTRIVPSSAVLGSSGPNLRSGLYQARIGTSGRSVP
jgi:hypothetical protein